MFLILSKSKNRVDIHCQKSTQLKNNSIWMRGRQNFSSKESRSDEVLSCILIQQASINFYHLNKSIWKSWNNFIDHCLEIFDFLIILIADRRVSFSTFSSVLPANHLGIVSFRRNSIYQHLFRTPRCLSLPSGQRL